MERRSQVRERFPCRIHLNFKSGRYYKLRVGCAASAGPSTTSARVHAAGPLGVSHHKIARFQDSVYGSMARPACA